MARSTHSPTMSFGTISACERAHARQERVARAQPRSAERIAPRVAACRRARRTDDRSRRRRSQRREPRLRHESAAAPATEESRTRRVGVHLQLRRRARGRRPARAGHRRRCRGGRVRVHPGVHEGLSIMEGNERRSARAYRTRRAPCRRAGPRCLFRRRPL